MPARRNRLRAAPPPQQPKSLLSVLGQSEHVKDLVEQSAQELSSVNSELARDMTATGEPSNAHSTLEKSQAVEDKVQDAAGKLAQVNQALAQEVGARLLLEDQLAVVTRDEEVARHAALHDPLTGLPNRVLFDDRLAHGLAQAKRHGRTLAVMFLDLDKFKQINDQHGHDVGDAVLTTVADRLRENTRQDDTVSRIGGDEFLYLAADFGDLNDVILIAEKITQALRAPCLLAVGELRISASIGIAVYPKDGDSAQALVKRADQAMYLAKDKASGFVFAG